MFISLEEMSNLIFLMNYSRTNISIYSVSIICIFKSCNHHVYLVEYDIIITMRQFLLETNVHEEKSFIKREFIGHYFYNLYIFKVLKAIQRSS